MEKKKHFLLISSMSRLLRKGNQRNQRFYCDNCLNSRRTKESLAKHKTYFEACKKVFPKNDFMQFKNHKNQTSIPFRIYADSEAILKPCEDQGHGEYQKHQPCGFCFYTVTESGEKFSPILTRGENCIEEFLDKLIDHVVQLQNQPPKPIIMTKEDEDLFQKSINCWFCNGEIKERKVRDHCHFTGKFRGAAHSKCNLLARKPQFTPVFFHNLFGYDIHHFVTALSKKRGNIRCILNNEEKYVSFSISIPIGKKIFHEIKFLDSMKFMASSLDGLIKNLQKDQLIYTKNIFGNKADLLARKGVYPYEFMDSFEKFNHQLPKNESFFSSLNSDGISNEDYEHARNIWETFQMKNMGEYHDLYLKSDVVLLADVFENFRKPCLATYELHPCWYLTAPSFAWDCFLKITRVKMELLKRPDMHLFFEKQIRGGVSTAFHRYAKANNKFMKDYDPSKPSSFIMYFDANSLYPTAMCKPLPLRDFKWMKDDELQNWESILKTDKQNCVLEVDLYYPQHLHDDHNDYPLAPERLKINGVEKLIPNLQDKTKMILHAASLKQYLDNGMKIKKFILEYHFMKKHI